MTNQPDTPHANTVSKLRWGLGAHATGTEALYREGDAAYWTAFKHRNPALAAKVEDAYNEFVKLREKPGDNGPLSLDYYSEHFDRWLAEAAFDQGIHEAIERHDRRTRSHHYTAKEDRPTPLTVAEILKYHRRRGGHNYGEAK